jgi:hypothetical protein
MAPARKLPQPLVPFSERPACFDSQRQWIEWQTLELACLRRLRFGPCTDCTHRYQARMINENRCARPWLDLDFVKTRADTE